MKVIHSETPQFNQGEAKPTGVQRAMAAFKEGAAQQNASPEQLASADISQGKAIAQKIEAKAEAVQSDVNEAAPSTEQVESKAAAPEATKTEEEKLLSSQYAILARKEKAFRQNVQQKEQALKAKEAELLAKEQALSKGGQIDESKYISMDRLKDDLMGVIAQAGISPDDVANALLEQPKRDPYVTEQTRRLEAKIQELEKKLDGTSKSIVTQQEDSYKSAIAQIDRDAKALVDSDPMFETIKSTGQHKEITKLIESTFKTEGYVMSVEEAATEIENELLERFLSTAQSVKKIQERLQPKASAKPEAVKKQESAPAQQSQLKTLTNAVGTQRKLTAVERAIAVFKGEKIE